MSNAELVDLAKANMIDVKGPSSTLVPAFADIIEKKARAEGLVREVQPEEPKAAKKTAAKKTATKKAVGSKAATDDSSADAVAPAKKAAAKKAATPKEAALKVDVETPVVEAPIAESPAPAAPEAPAATVSETPAPAAEATPAPTTAAAPASGARVISGRDTTQGITRPMTRPAPESRPAPATPAPPADGRPAASAPAGAPPRPSAPPPRPMSPSGRPVPPPPGRPMSPSGRPVPPPPGGPRAAGPRPGGYSTGPRPGGAARPAGGPRPGGFGGPRPGGGPGGPGRPGGGPGGGPGGPGRPGGGPGRPGGGPRPSGGRRAPRGRRRRRGEEELQPGEIRYTESTVPVPEGIVVIERGVSAQEFAPRLNRTAADVVRFLMKNGEMVTATMTLADEQMELFALDIGAEILLVEPGQQEEMELQALFDDSDDIDEAAQQPRPPVITVMGHVDHGKTTLLDRIRNANVVEGEAGGITQHIGAYQTEQNGKRVTFIDTPGHAAFTKMRARGAQVTDIVVLMVAADDGVMPQTVEAIAHARAAEVPIVVAVNKVDKENADVQKVLAQLAENELAPESWGGDTICVEMSAQQGLGVDDLLEQLTLVAELEELTANPSGRAKGIVLEANLDVGRGPVATILVDKGTLKVGDPIVAGAAWGRVRAMIDDKGQQIKEAGPSTPVQVLGLSSVPNAGDEFRAAPDEKTARTVGDAREARQRAKSQRGDARVQKGVKLEDVFSQIQAGEVATLNLVIKADVQGSLEAVSESLRRLEREEVKLAFVHRGVGGITENDITLASATNATIIGFNVRPDRKARDLAENEKVEIRTYEIIYKLLEDIEKAMLGMLAPEYEEVVTGEAEVREIFRVPKIGAIAGCYVRSGQITRGSKVRFLRDGVIIWKGSIQSLRRFKDDVREVRDGFECGIGLSDFQDLKQGDLIETYEDKLIVRT
ncbi:MAG: translation initiation factor IF-2 [Actinomycetota bacterium]|nr:translation initiation factor IF-2 [Actinomycetota bacterium]MDA3025407.1 translation initiation factor IF-2 [Actinomycetota bacterium]